MLAVALILNLAPITFSPSALAAESPASLAAEPDTVSHVQAEVASASAQQSPSGVATPPPGQKWRTYYYAGGAQPIAVRETTNDGGNTLHYLHSDHLGSTSAVTCGNAAGCATAGGTVPNGGVVARQSYYLLQQHGVYVDQLILRGSYVREISLPNVGRVDYITSHFDHWYSFDVNPFDSVSVQEHVVNFRGHVPPTAYNVAEIGDLIINLMVDYK
jgi:hypothetical protein